MCSLTNQNECGHYEASTPWIIRLMKRCVHYLYIYCSPCISLCLYRSVRFPVCHYPSVSVCLCLYVCVCVSVAFLISVSSFVHVLVCHSVCCLLVCIHVCLSLR